MPSPPIVRKWLGHVVLQNMMALWGAQFVRKLVPIILMPYLGRVLGPGGLGLLAFVQGFNMLLGVFVEFGFNFSATREIAQAREDRPARTRIVAGVLGAQMLLAVAGTIVLFTAALFVPMLRAHQDVLCWGLALCIADGLLPYWYFQGMERLRLVAVLDIGSKALAAAAIIALVTRPDQVWAVLAIQALTAVVSSSIALALCLRQAGFSQPSIATVQETLRNGWPMFVFRSSDSLYSLSNSFILGLFAAPALVGYYAGAEKIAKAFFGLLNPIREALYPRLSKLVKDAPGEASRLARLAAWVTISGGVLLGALVYLLAPVLVRLFLGPAFGAAVPVLRILSLMPPLMAITHSVGFQYLLPHGRTDVINRIMISAAAFNLVLALLLAPRWAHAGMAVSVVTAEAFLCLRMIHAVYSIERRRNAPSPLEIRANEA